MICEKCGKYEATVTIKENINGKKRTMHLCSRCADEYQAQNMNPIMGNIFGPFFGVEQTQKQQYVCKDCGTTLEEFLNTGFLGCPNCYNNLRAEIEPSIRNVQRGIYHIGKRMEEKNTNVVENHIEPKDRKQELTEKLHELVKQERYEEAARVRDEIKRLGE